MTRVILDDCRPCLYALCVAVVALWLVLRASGMRLDLRRLRQLPSCQRGGVQSLAFVLTLPVFVMIVMFIVQVSQLMIAQVVVNYAAYSAVRSLSAWVPQYVVEVAPGGAVNAPGSDIHDQNRIADPRIAPGPPSLYGYQGGPSPNHAKLDRPFASAVTACAVISPSRPLGMRINSFARLRYEATAEAWRVLVGPASRSTEARLYNKLAYSYWNTEMWVSVENRNSNLGPTDNPMDHPNVNYIDNEIGWQDPMTVTIRHHLALLPGPGRFLARYLVRPGGPPDLVSGRIRQRSSPGGGNSRRFFTTTIWARATVTNDGIKSLVPYTHAIELRY